MGGVWAGLENEQSEPSRAEHVFLDDERGVLVFLSKRERLDMVREKRDLRNG